MKVLLVDDEPDIRTIGRMGLEELGGFDVILAASGTEALAVFETTSPDLVLLDMMMPVMNGVETFNELQARMGSARVPIVFMTAKARPSELERYLALGAAGVIPKPFDPVTLPDELHRIYETWHRRPAESTE